MVTFFFRVLAVPFSSSAIFPVFWPAKILVPPDEKATLGLVDTVSLYVFVVCWTPEKNAMGSTKCYTKMKLF